MKLVKDGKIIYQNILTAETEWEKIRGLMFRKEKIGMILETRFGIHSFFVLYPLTVFICNNDWKVVKIKRKMIPFAFFFWNPKYKKVIELPFGNYEVKMGDKLEII